MTAAQREGQPLVLAALDGSPAAAAALPLARTVAEQLHATVEILHVAREPMPDAALLEWLHLTSEELQGAKLRLEIGDAVEGILRRTADPLVAIVVLTTHGREVESGARLGRVAEAVIARTEQPILIERPETAPDAGVQPRTLRRLLLPVDGTPTTAVALRPATKLCSLLGASIDLLYVTGAGQLPPNEPGSIGAPRYVDQPQHEWPQWTAEVLNRLVACCAACPPDVPVHAYLGLGDAGTEIVRFASAHDHDAIVLARRSRLEPGRAATLRTLLARTPCPIVLVGAPSSVPVEHERHDEETRLVRPAGVSA